MASHKIRSWARSSKTAHNPAVSFRGTTTEDQGYPGSLELPETLVSNTKFWISPSHGSIVK